MRWCAGLPGHLEARIEIELASNTTAFNNRRAGAHRRTQLPPAQRKRRPRGIGQGDVNIKTGLSHPHPDSPNDAGRTCHAECYRGADTLYISWATSRINNNAI
jgi:hypothetical protein